MNKYMLLFLVGISYATAEAQSIPEKKDSVHRFIRLLRTDRPGVSESPFLIDRGDLQMETGFSLQLDNSRTFRRQSITYFSALTKLGISSHCELRLLTEYVRDLAYDHLNDKQSVSAGWMPLLAGTKIVVMEGRGWLPQMSFIGYLKLSMVGAYASRNMAPLLKVTCEHTLSQDWALGYNLAANWDGEQPDASGLYTLYVSRSLSRHAGMFVEMYGFFGPGYQPDHRADTGFTYSLDNNLRLDLSGGLGFSEESPDGFINMGLAWRIFKP